MSRHYPIGVALILALSLPALADEFTTLSPAQPAIASRRLSVSDFGAVGDSRTVSTKAFEAAIQAIDKAGGGTLIVPSGTYLTGPLSLCSGLNLRLEKGARIVFSDKPGDYREERGSRLAPQLRGNGVHDVEISGEGTIDGQGGTWWPAAQAARDPKTGQQYHGTTARPATLVFAKSSRIRVESITIVNSPNLNLGINDCDDVTIEGITIKNPPDSPNTDGIDPKGARRVLISHCTIDTGDDCVAAGGSRGVIEKDILVTDCTFLHGHGCSIGSGTAGGVVNFTVQRCTFDGTESGIRLKSARGRGGVVDHVLYADLTMTRVGHPISINSHYEGTTTDTAGLGHSEAMPVTSLTPRWHHVVIRNVVARESAVDAGLILGLPEMPVDGIALDNVHIDAPKGLQVAYADNVVLHDVVIHASAGEPIMLADTVTRVTR